MDTTFEFEISGTLTVPEDNTVVVVKSACVSLETSNMEKAISKLKQTLVDWRSARILKVTGVETV